MTFAAITFPSFNQVAFEIGVVKIRWYGLAYVFGLLLAWWYATTLLKEKWWPDGPPISRKDLEDIIFWSFFGIFFGGRLGYVLFYKPSFYFAEPDQIIRVWDGGMSFHGGLIGVTLAVILFAVRRNKSMFAIGDIAGCIAPIGLFLGRIANFVNGELYGRETGTEWGVIFRNQTLPRHPSQLYEAALEGIVLFVILRILFTQTNLRFRPGTLCGAFFIGYGLSRIFVEFFREPDSFLGFLRFGASMGQLLSIPMILFGSWLVWRARKPA